MFQDQKSSEMESKIIDTENKETKFEKSSNEIISSVKKEKKSLKMMMILMIIMMVMKMNLKMKKQILK